MGCFLQEILFTVVKRGDISFLQLTLCGIKEVIVFLIDRIGAACDEDFVLKVGSVLRSLALAEFFFVSCSHALIVALNVSSPGC